LIRQAGIPLASVDLDQPMADAWADVLEGARRRDKLRVLLTNIANSPDSAVYSCARNRLQYWCHAQSRFDGQ
jgi:hypothetical protein